ncbi:MAG: tRNA uridine-5-carboxymethylaminomethyl(34) synthesis GTPase MnmE, partial [Pontixanthobacter sp.]
LKGIPFAFVDTAGLRDFSDDAIEIIGIDRARQQFDRADTVLWLGAEGEGPDGSIEIVAKSDLLDTEAMNENGALRVSAKTGQGIERLKTLLIHRAREAMPKPGALALNARQVSLIEQAYIALCDARIDADMLVIGEHLRLARLAFDRLVGRTSTEDMLDTLFGKFCIGK